MNKNLDECRLLVTPTSFGKNDPRMRAELEARCRQVIFNDTGKPLRSAELIRLLPGIDGYIAGLDEIDAAAIDAADCLEVIARYGVGVDNVDLAAATARGIVVTNTPGANSVSVAELTVALLLTLARQVAEATSNVRQGGWPRVAGLSLKGKTVGLLGFGNIGREVAKRLVVFDCRVLTYDPYVTADTAVNLGAVLVSLDVLQAESDFLSLHLPVTPDTRGLVNAAFLARMKRGAYLVNTARGELIEEAALVNALERGQLRGAALDVFSIEPPDPANPLLQLRQVVVTPHMAAHADDAITAMGSMAMDDCLAVLQGFIPAHRVA